MWSVQINNASIYELKPVTLIMLLNEYWLIIMIIKANDDNIINLDKGGALNKNYFWTVGF